jgi:hypothetical protein
MGFLGGMGKALMAPGKLMHKATMGVGKAVGKGLGAVHKGTMKAGKAVTRPITRGRR